MNGNRYVLDTNAIVSLLQGSSQLIQLLQDADWIGVKFNIKNNLISMLILRN